MSTYNGFDREWLDREVPAGMTLDVAGLVESWVAEAEDWLTAFDGIDKLTPEEAFEGIEFFGRLARTRKELLEECDGTTVLDQLRSNVCGKNASLFFELAVSFVNLDAWLKQALEAWDDEDADGDTDLSEMLLMDLDAAESLQRFGETFARGITDETYARLEDGLLECRHWAANHTEWFIVAEPLVRAVAKTIDEAVLDNDETGILPLSVMKFVNFLDTADRLWEDMRGLPSLDFIHSQPKFGRRPKDHEYQTASAAAAAPQQYLAAQMPVRWHSPDEAYEAVYFLPPIVSPDEPKEVEIIFGAGSDFSEPAMELVGRRVSMGNAGATIEVREQGGFQLVYARVNRDEISAPGGADVRFSVDNQEWA